jgi:hypothetical protein
VRLWAGEQRNLPVVQLGSKPSVLNMPMVRSLGRENECRELYFDGVSEKVLRHRSMHEKSKILRPYSQRPASPLVSTFD